jgi:hypothetical protein
MADDQVIRLVIDASGAKKAPTTSRPRNKSSHPRNESEGSGARNFWRDAAITRRSGQSVTPSTIIVSGKGLGRGEPPSGFIEFAAKGPPEHAHRLLHLGWSRCFPSVAPTTRDCDRGAPTAMLARSAACNR